MEPTAAPRAPRPNAFADPDATLLERYRRVRDATERLCAPLSAEDQTVQSMPDASPAKWHRAHTTWFFEVLVLEPREGYRPFQGEFRTLFNSYYNSIGDQHARFERGLITRPGVAETGEYRRYVDRHMEEVLSGDVAREVARVVEVGLNHEQQHQELLLTDVKHLLSRNPLHPRYHQPPPEPGAGAAPLGWIEYEGGRHEIGHDGNGFAYDNESPRHAVLLRPFEVASRPVTNREYLAFMEDGGYDDPRWWLSDGWATIQAEGWRAPGYWQARDGAWHVHTLHGFHRVDPEEPVCHVSLFEADAYSRWAGARLPTEAEWEVAAARLPTIRGNLVDTGRLHPAPYSREGAAGAGDAPRDGGPVQMFGDVWEWTGSPYVSYPGYRPPEGPLGEYNSKFMCNQMVLRGGSCATPGDHIRPTYRNFFPPGARWQFSGFRLARDG